MKKVLFIVEAMGGGIFTYIVELANELADHYEVHVAYSLRSQTPKDYKNYFDRRVHLTRVKHFVRNIRPLSDLKALFEIRRIVKEIAPDIIHLHSSKAGVLGRIAFAGSGIPLFYTPHGYYFLTESRGSIKRLFYWMVEYACAKGRCTTISCGIGEHRETLKLTSKAVYVDNGVCIEELQELANAISTQENHPFTVFTLGRICFQKNPGLFNEIAKALPDVRFLWIGDGELKNDLIAPNIEITGWVDRRKALEYSMRGDVFLLTSRWEGLSMSLLEAMYLRKLCVVSDCIGNRDVINNGRNGYICRRADEFVDIIHKLQAGCMDDVLDAAFHDVCENYNISVMVERYRKIYEQRF